MGIQCLVDKTLESNLTGASHWCVGLLVGAVIDQKYHIVHFAKTPLEDPDRSGGLNGLKDILVSSHGRELQRMLPGGLAVCGFVAIAESASLSNCQAKFQQIMAATYKKLLKGETYSTVPDDWVLLTLDQTTKRFTSKSITISDYKSSMRPADVKFQAISSGWLIAETSLAVDRTFQLSRQQQDHHFEEQLLTGLLPFLTRISTSRCLFHGCLMQDDDVLGQSASSKGKRSSSAESPPQHINVQFLAKSAESSSSSCEETISTIQIQGTVSAIAFLRTPTTAKQVEQALKNDLKKSITLRCQLLCEDILQVGSEKHIEEKMVYETPPRVYIPLQNVPVVFNDYMFKDEKVEDCAARAQQILGIELDSNVIDITVERSADAGDVKSLQTSEVESDDPSDEDVTTESFARSLGRIASIASGAAIVLAVSLSYLNMDDWFS